MCVEKPARAFCVLGYSFCERPAGAGCLWRRRVQSGAEAGGKWESGFLLGI